MTRRTMIMRMFQWLVAALGGWILWFTRVPQVTAFLAAAAIRSRDSNRADLGPASQSVNWASIDDASMIRLATGNPRALVTYHPEYHGHRPQLAVASLQKAAEIGFGWVRTDLRWNQIIPAGSQPSLSALAWYRSFLVASAKIGLKNMVVLSTPPKLAQSGLVEWQRFVDVVINELGEHCDAYQLFNEPNNPVYRVFDLDDTVLGIRTAAEMVRNVRPKPIVVNVAMDIWGWQQYAETLLRECGESIDVLGLDSYPGTWSVGFSQGWKEVVKIAKAASETNQSVWSKRRIALLETGYATNLPTRSEREQNTFYIDLFKEFKTFRLAEVLAYLGVYELVDANSSSGMNPEAHFGLMTTDLKPKTAVQTVKTLISTY